MHWRLGAFAVLVAATLTVGDVAAQQRGRFHQSVSDYEARRRLVNKDYEGAIREANQALKEHPGDPLALTNRGFAYLELGDYAHAVEDHDAVLLIAPENP